MKRLEAGALIGGDYRIERLLGEGGMGAVYVAHQSSTGKLRAIKTMQSSLLLNEGLRQRFVQEARVGSRIRSDHIVEVIAAGVDDATGIPWMAMELLEGWELRHRLDRGPLPAPEARQVIGQLCDALGAAHQAGVVHRDLKPENVFLATALRRGVPFTVKVLDFGIARIVDETKASLHQTRGALGTPLYMAPEQAQPGAPVTPATDIWALGLMVFEMLTGKIFWRAAHVEGASGVALTMEAFVEPLPSASLRARELGCEHLLPAGFDEWFASTVCRSIPSRCADASLAFARLEALLAHPLALAPTLPGSAAAPMVAEPVARLRRWIAFGVAAAMVVLLGTGAAWLALRPTTSESTAEASEPRRKSQKPKTAPDALPDVTSLANIAWEEPKEFIRNFATLDRYVIALAAALAKGTGDTRVLIVPFVDVMQRTMMVEVRRELERRIRDESNATPYQNLRLAKMLAEPDRLDVEWATGVCASMWWDVALEQHPNAPAPDALHPHAELYFRLVADHKVVPLPLDATAVGLAEAEAREYRLIALQDRFVWMTETAPVAPGDGTRYPGITSDTLWADVSLVAKHIRSRNDTAVTSIWGVCTEKGRAQVLGDLTSAGYEAHRTRDGWLLPELYAQSGDAVASDIDDLRFRYRTQCADTWDLWLIGLEGTAPETPTDAQALWTELSRAPSPLERLGKAISTNALTADVSGDEKQVFEALVYFLVSTTRSPNLDEYTAIVRQLQQAPTSAWPKLQSDASTLLDRVEQERARTVLRAVLLPLLTPKPS